MFDNWRVRSILAMLPSASLIEAQIGQGKGHDTVRTSRTGSLAMDQEPKQTELLGGESRNRMPRHAEQKVAPLFWRLARLSMASSTRGATRP